MKFLLSILVGLLLEPLHAAPAANLAAPRIASESSRSSAAGTMPRPRLAWFNALDRSFSLETSEGPVRVTLHSPNGSLVAVVHQGVLAKREILRVQEDLPPGVYLLRVRQATTQSLDRITLF